MNVNRLAAILSAGIVSVCLAPTAEATLLSRLDGKAVYDTDLDITWIADANLAASYTFGVDPSLINADGTMNWYTAQWDWIPAMNAHEGTGYLGFNDWRLPVSQQPDFQCTVPISAGLGSVGHNCVGSEMGHLFYEELGGTPDIPILDSDDPDVALFKNLANTGGRGGFWSATVLAYDPTFAYYFYFDNNIPLIGEITAGIQNTGPKFNNDIWVAWAVRDGDVLRVPEPATLGLYVAGLALLLAGRRARSAPERR
jgi:hypothetical protein